MSISDGEMIVGLLAGVRSTGFGGTHATASSAATATNAAILGVREMGLILPP
ncbi:MAG: hypothetical protein M5U31_01065 [Acidimicrobiia bacterium]|nr:hypothetical protein [Acidimicrobiia bacterium]